MRQREGDKRETAERESQRVRGNERDAVCVRETEREHTRERERERERERQGEREGERQHERANERERGQ